jgi:hypothetical protein
MKSANPTTHPRGLEQVLSRPPVLPVLTNHIGVMMWVVPGMSELARLEKMRVRAT